MAVDKDVLVFGEWSKRGYLPTAEGICICECPVHGRLTEKQIASVVLVVLEVHGEEFSTDIHLTREEVRATVLALLAERPESFREAVGQNGHAPTQEKIRGVVREFMREHREEFQGPEGKRGPRGFTGPMGARGFPGRPPTAGEIGAAVSAYYLARARKLDPETYMWEAVAAYRAQQRQQWEQPVPRRGFLGWVRRLAMPLVTLAALAIAIVALFLPAQPSAQEVATLTKEQLKGDPAFVVSVTGAVGATGLQGIPGKDADPTAVAAAITGNPINLALVKGVKGEPGPVGKDGVPGLRGSAGPAGVQGISGPQGPAGESGPAGKGGASAEEVLSKIKGGVCESTSIPRDGHSGGTIVMCPWGTFVMSFNGEAGPVVKTALKYGIIDHATAAKLLGLPWP